MTKLSKLGTPFTPRRALAVAAALAVASTATACSSGSGGGGGDSGAQQAPTNPVSVNQVPDYYPADYSQLIEAAKKEGGTLNIYSNTDQENWDPIFRDFKTKYPFIKELKASNLGSDEVFQRVLSENAAGGSTTDLAVSNAAQAWAKFAKQPNVLLEYKSPEDAKVPDFAKPLPNVYAFSNDPMMLAYNDELIGDKKPTGLASLASIVEAKSNDFNNKITSRAVDGAFGFTVSYAMTKDNPQMWTNLEKVLPLARPEDSSGTQIDKIQSGEYVAGFLISSAVSYNAEEKSKGLLKGTYLDDGTPVLARGIGILAKAPHPATAKLFEDFVLSQEGQQATAEGGLTSYREGVTSGKGIHTYQELVKDVGQANVKQVQYAEVPPAEVKAFVDRWNGLLAK